MWLDSLLFNGICDWIVYEKLFVMYYINYIFDISF